MLTTFNVFKMLMGIIVSIFILLLLFRLSSSFIGIGEAKREIKTFYDFNRIVKTVYTSGIAENVSINSKSVISYIPPDIVTSSGSTTLDVPTIFVSGDELLVYKSSIDYGFFSYNFILAIPETRIGFVPISNDMDVWAAIKNITKILPSTENLYPKLYFGAGCNSSTFYRPRFERKKFEIAIELFKTDFNTFFDNDCWNVNTHGYRIIKIYPRGTKEENIRVKDGIAIVTGDNKMFVNRSGEIKKYSIVNFAEVIAMLLNGEEGYNFFRNDFLRKVSNAVSIKTREYELLSNKDFSGACIDEYRKMVSILTEIENSLEKEELVNILEEAKMEYQIMRMMGCE